MQKIHFPRRKKNVIALTAIIAISTSLLWSLHARSAENKTSKTTPTVKITPVKEAEKNIPLEISGFVRGKNRADIPALASGKILNIFKQEGDVVKSGEVIAKIDANQIDAQISATNSNIAALEKTLKDSEKYYDQLVDEAKSADDDADTDASSEAVKSAKRGRDLQIQAMRDQVVSAKGMLEITKSGKNNFSVIAPFSGKITAVHGRIGGFASFGAPLFSLSSDDTFEIETYVSASEGRQVSVGNAVTFFAENNTPVMGSVSAKSTGSDTQSLKTLIRIQLNDTTQALQLGDFLHGEIMIAREQTALSIPSSAIISHGGDTIVFIVDENNLAKEQPVKTGAIHNGMVDILEGLSNNQNVVTEGQQYLINNLTVKIYATK